MQKITQSSDYYDDMFAKGGDGFVYDLAYERSSYYPLFRGVLKEVRRVGAQRILEVGCGTGGFSHLLKDTVDIPYSGFDFSSVAVEKARRRTGDIAAYFVGDATDAKNYKAAYDTIVCTEVLEHIEKDIDVIHLWRSGTKCVCSVPNFDADSHERFFRSEQDVASRYGDRIDIERIVRIRKPVLADISWGNYARAIRWYRSNPQRLMAVLGIGSFDSLGGWFLFTGRKR